ncbi:hypothetical protein BIY27_06315 [Gibbsiella quercinecans]|nr:hypothetical protein BIY27_06315 [Gibbsiella quercinecans]
MNHDGKRFGIMQSLFCYRFAQNFSCVSPGESAFKTGGKRRGSATPYLCGALRGFRQMPAAANRLLQM